ncbi:hypothetical protein EX349_11105 [Pseudomonas protegens]|nr:hypothetical protein [Pseudomonas protegens]NUE76922.1 hypothetical protein [Pseudomonas protegens]
MPWKPCCGSGTCWRPGPCTRPCAPWCRRSGSNCCAHQEPDPPHLSHLAPPPPPVAAAAGCERSRSDRRTGATVCQEPSSGLLRSPSQPAAAATGSSGCQRSRKNSPGVASNCWRKAAINAEVES